MAAKKKSSRRNSSKPPPAALPIADLDQTQTEEAGAVSISDGAHGFPVVGLGASAGGLEAFKKFFDAMPSDTGVAFVLIQHLDPTHESMTAELLRRHTQMPVVEVEDEMPLQPNRVHVIPPNRYLSISGETLHLSAPIERRGVRVPIDFFFRSLADDQHEKGIAVILSGTGSDGTLGVREIKAAGGMVMVQEPATAQFDGMPRSALATGMVDYNLPVEKMPEVLRRYVQHWYVQGVAPPRPAATDAPDVFDTVLALIRARAKYDFSGYKKGTVTRRIQRRMGLHHIGDMDRYVQMLRDKDDEVTALFKDLLISVTNFFREPEAWTELEAVIDGIIRNKKNDTPIRIWSAGCATGEEAYSLAMLLLERLQTAGKVCGIQVFASDIDFEALQFARAGIYPENIAADVSPERLRQFFIKGEHTYRINKEIRDAVVFAEQNIISDPPFSKLDLISCRNVLIYLEPKIQKRIFHLFHFALREDGYVFLGNAENINQPDELFEPVSRKWRIYRRLSATARHDRIMPLPPRTEPARHEPPKMPQRPADGRMHTLAQQLVIQRFVPPSVLVNRKGEVLYLYGAIDQFLQLPAGELGADLLGMAREGLRTKLRSALHQAIQYDKTVTLGGAQLKNATRSARVRITVDPLRIPREAAGLLLVTFAEEHAGQDAAASDDDGAQTHQEFETIITQLEDDLRGTREDLQSTIEELETSNEEFKAANEEVTSINEELQSTNEELETSKEELQSLNEELNTVNNQLETKVNELEIANNDLHNLLVSTDLATIFLDRRFCIKRFTPAVTRLLRVIPADVGRLLSDLVHNFSDQDLLNDAEMVLLKLTSSQKEIQSTDGRWYIRRVVPYRTEDDHIDGVVITFVDITELKQAQTQLQKSNAELEQRVIERTLKLDAAHKQLQADFEHLREAGAVRRRLAAIMQAGAAALINVNDDGVIIDWNAGAERLYGYTAAEAVGRNIAMLLPPERGQDFNSILQLLRASERVDDYETVRLRKDHQRVEVVLSAALMREEDGGRPSLCEIGQDISERKLLQQQLTQVSEREQQRIGHELHDTLGQQISGLGLLAASLYENLQKESSPYTALVDRIARGIEDAKSQIRSLSNGLLPVVVDASELAPALQQLAQQTTETFGIDCACHTAANTPAISAFAAAHLYRIAQEAVHNAVKHAQAKNITIRLKDDGGVTLTVEDDGVGIAPEKKYEPGMGLRIMQYRAHLINGALTVQSRGGEGTTVTCTIPARGEPS